MPIGIDRKCTKIKKTQLKKGFNPNYIKESKDKGLGFDNNWKKKKLEVYIMKPNL